MLRALVTVPVRRVRSWIEAMSKVNLLVLVAMVFLPVGADFDDMCVVMTVRGEQADAQ